MFPDSKRALGESDVLEDDPCFRFGGFRFEGLVVSREVTLVGAFGRINLRVEGEVGLVVATSLCWERKIDSILLLPRLEIRLINRTAASGWIAFISCR